MSLNKSSGNMYEFVTHTWNAIKGKCLHDCIYCYMKKFGKLDPVRIDNKEFNTNLGKDNFIFIGSSTDMFAADIPNHWISDVLNYADNFDNKYFYQSKDPNNFINFMNHSIMKKSVFCTTLETNLYDSNFHTLTVPSPLTRAKGMQKIKLAKYITIEPIVKFELKGFIELIKMCEPIQVNIGADSGGHKLNEPSRNEILELINELQKFTHIKEKKNLERLTSEPGRRARGLAVCR